MRLKQSMIMTATPTITTMAYDPTPVLKSLQNYIQYLIKSLAMSPQATAHRSRMVRLGSYWQAKQQSKKHKLDVLGRLVASHWAAVDPKRMGLGPVHATVPMLGKQKLTCG